MSASSVAIHHHDDDGDTTHTSTSSTNISSVKSILHGLQVTFGTEIMNEILHHTRILLVGAGGIGCELIKNLVLCGYTNITMIDLDTIDISNLNRQLLFRTHHVGQPKCHVACSVAKQLSIHHHHGSYHQNDGHETNPTTVPLNYVAHHGNVCDNTQFNTEFMKQFDIVLNALDNVTARKRMNRLCLATGIPLIEAGTTGYLGQVSTIHKPSHTACYECYTQEMNKVYPICTIRSTPSQPVHCIVWAKELYKLLFSTAETFEESMLYEAVSGGSNHTSGKDGTNDANATAAVTEKTTGDDGDLENGNGSGEPSTYMQAVLDFRQLLQQRRAGNSEESSNENTTAAMANAMISIGTQLIQNLYVDEIQKQLNMDRYKTAQKKPMVLSESVVGAAATTDTGNTTGSSVTTPPSSQSSYQNTNIWTPEECVIEFIACLYDAVRNSELVLPSFDKDDVLCMRFITASANLRSIVFGIQPIQSYYSAKGIAGNIIPAIATTNAIVAGLQILQCFQVLKAQIEHKKKRHEQSNGSDNINEDELTSLYDYCSYVNCIRNPTRNGLYLTAAKLEHRNPKCFVCSKATISLKINVKKWTLQDFIQKLCKQEFGFEFPSITMDNTGNCIWEEGEGADTEAYEMNLTKKLPNLPCGGIVNSSVITVEDYTQDLTVDIAITHVEQWDAAVDGEEGEDIPDDHKFIVGGDTIKPPTQPVSETATLTGATADNKHDDDKDEIIEIVGASNLKDDNTEEDNDDIGQAPQLSGMKRSSAVTEDTSNAPSKKLKTTDRGNRNDNEYIEIE